MFSRGFLKKKRLNVFYGRLGRTRHEKYRDQPSTSIDSVANNANNDNNDNHVMRPRPIDFDNECDTDKDNNMENGHDDLHNTPESNRYSSEKKSRLEDWQEVRSQFFESFTSGEWSSDQCKLYRCLDCCQWQHICIECLTNQHKFPHLHKFESWTENAYIGFNIETPTWKMAHTGTCETKYCKSLTIVDDKGRQHIRILEFCKCEKESATLIKYHLWPSTVKSPQLAFSMELLKWMNGLFLESHMSVLSFCQALKARASKHDRPYVTEQVKDIYKSLMTETWEEFRHFISLTENYFDDGTECPACYQCSNKYYAFDADFQLVRKKSAGRQWSEPKTSKFFLNQQAVDEFISTYGKDQGKPIQDCSDFQAGNNLRSKSKFSKLDETAVFGSTCRHGFPKYFFSLKHGERLGYAVYMLQQLLDQEINSDKIFIMYDIACSLKKHLIKQGNDSVLEKIILAIPIFHSYGHKVSCQVQYGPRRVQGMGLTDGESVERMWAYLGQYSKSTKETTPENRIDSLVEALLYFGRILKDKFTTSLPEKLLKAQELETASRKSLNELLESFHPITESTIYQWVEEEQQIYSKQPTERYSTEEEYVRALDLLRQNENNATENNSTKLKSRILRRKLSRILKSNMVLNGHTKTRCSVAT